MVGVFERNCNSLNTDIEKSLFCPSSEFFIISSDNLEEIQSSLYGFCYVDNKIVENVDDIGKNEPNGDGAYVLIKRNNNIISIEQDFIGSYGLYLYNDETFFAISNSLIYLVDYIKTKRKITFNKKYADSFIISPLCSVSCQETIINEITMLDRNAIAMININSRHLSIIYKDNQENSIKLDTEGGMEILDNWFNKWTSIIRNLKRQTNRISVDLSGGFDSRLTFLLFAASNIDLNEIRVSSMNDQLHTHKEDFEIASQIANHYKFELNNTSNMKCELLNYTLNDVINSSFYTKLSFHKQMYYKCNKSLKNRYMFGGHGGECIREYWNNSENDYINEQLSRIPNYFNRDQTYSQIEENIRSGIQNNLNNVKQKYTSNENDIVSNLYRDTRCRNHFGKAVVENYFGGYITLSPLLDRNLHKLKLNCDGCKDKNLLMAIILTRYDKDIIKFKFDSGKVIAEQTIKYAEEINKKYPYIKTTRSFVKKQHQTENDLPVVVYNNKKACTTDDVNSFIEKVFLSSHTRKSFELLYGEHVYNSIFNDRQKQKWHPQQQAITVIAICKFLQDTIVSQNVNSSDCANSLYEHKNYINNCTNTLKNHPYIQDLITARLDIINQGSDKNDIEIKYISDSNSIITTPSWYRNNGIGHMLRSVAGKLDIEFKCIKSGNLTISLKSQDIKEYGTNGLMLDYKYFKVNNDIVFDDIRALSYASPFKFNKKVKDGEIIKISVSWEPHKSILSNSNKIG